jgi:carboxymethylenebutenolidase
MNLCCALIEHLRSLRPFRIALAGALAYLAVLLVNGGRRTPDPVKNLSAGGAPGEGAPISPPDRAEAGAVPKLGLCADSHEHPSFRSRSPCYKIYAMPHEQVTIPTRDGSCPAHVFTPGDERGGPAIIFYMDAGGLRPAELQMAQRLADGGYVVLLPDLFYRYGPYGPFVPTEVFKGDVRAILGPLMATTGNDKAAEDTEAFLACLDARTDVEGGKAGAVGFCMGGGMAIVAAAAYPARFAAVASFHGGNLATDAPSSPHRLAPRLRAEVYIAAADHDDSYPPAMAARLEKALDEAGVRYRAETYLGAAHGWMKPDFPVYDPAAAERGWREMLTFFDRTLKPRTDR